MPSWIDSISKYDSSPSRRQVDALVNMVSPSDVTAALSQIYSGVVNTLPKCSYLMIMFGDSEALSALISKPNRSDSGSAETNGDKYRLQIFFWHVGFAVSSRPFTTMVCETPTRPVTRGCLGGISSGK